MPLQITPNVHSTANLRIAANQRARMSSIVSIDWDNVTDKPSFFSGGGIAIEDDVFTLQDDGDNTKQFQFQLSGITTGTTRTWTLPDANDIFLGLTATQSPTNKTLDNTNTITARDDRFTLQDSGDTTKQAQFQLSGITSATTRTYTLPDASGTLLYSGGPLGTPSSGVVTNLTGTASININGTVGATSQNSGQFTSLAYSTTLTGTSTNASALAVGRQGATDPVLKVNAATASVATGIEITGAAAAGGVNLAAISSGTNENLTINAKGSGTITLGGTSTGNIVIPRTITANTFTGAAGTNLTFTAGAADNVVFAVSGAATMILGSSTLYSNPGGTNLGLAGGFEFGALRLSKFVSTPAPATQTGNYSLAETDSSLIFNGSGSITLTLQAASSYSGRWLYLKNIAAFTVVSASSNVVPLAGGAAGTAILAASAGAWAHLQSDGTNWIIMAGS